MPIAFRRRNRSPSKQRNGETFGRKRDELSRRSPQPAQNFLRHYKQEAYARAIARGVAKANKINAQEAAKSGIEPAPIPDWSPNQLRHSAATEIRRKFGLEAAQTVLGHATADVTQIYAERDYALAASIMEKIG